MEQNIARSALVDALAANLKTHMDRLALSQPQLAQKSGVGQTTIGLYLNPDRRLPGKSGKIPSPKLAEVDLLARALGVDPLALLSLDHGVRGKAHQASHVGELSPAEQDLVVAFRMLPDDSQLELLHDVMAQAEHLKKLVKRELERQGIAVTGYVSATKAAEHLPPAPAPHASNVVKLPGFGVDAPPNYTLIPTPWRLVESPVRPKKKDGEE
jgi:transcriptional regulator with XRE-family HTH domain